MSSDVPASQVVVIDDHDLFSATLMITLRTLGIDARKVGADRLPVLAAQPSGGHPGVILLDLDLGPDGQGGRRYSYPWVRSLRERGWRVLIITGSEDDRAIAAAIAGGASGLLTKDTPVPELLQAISLVARGESLLDEFDRTEWAAKHRSSEEEARQVREAKARIAKLTPRESEVLESLVQGNRAAVIADEFVVSLATVRTHIRTILLKLEVGSQLEAVALVQRVRDWRHGD